MHKAIFCLFLLMVKQHAEWKAAAMFSISQWQRKPHAWAHAMSLPVLHHMGIMTIRWSSTDQWPSTDGLQPKNVLDYHFMCNIRSWSKTFWEALVQNIPLWVISHFSQACRQFSVLFVRMHNILLPYGLSADISHYKCIGRAASLGGVNCINFW